MDSTAVYALFEELQRTIEVQSKNFLTNLGVNLTRLAIV